MTVFVAFAPADRAAAEGLEKTLERRGSFVELDDGEAALASVRSNDCVVLVLSRALLAAPNRLRLEQRALDAWSLGRLVLVKLDDAAAPVGLRDLPTVGAEGVADAVAAAQRAAPAAAAPTGSRGRVLRAVASILLALPGIGALAALASIWLVNRIGPQPGGWPELRAGMDAFGARYGMPGGVTEWAFAGAILVTALVLLRLLLSLARRLRTHPARPRKDSVFVSFAREEAGLVAPLCKSARKAFHLRTDSDDAARVIRDAAGVVVMCSRAAFEDDRVKRELYLADRYRKPLAPVMLEDATPPEDFAHFLFGVPVLKLFDTPEAERPQALARVLGAAA
jgi:hypothetical protein